MKPADRTGFSTRSPRLCLLTDSRSPSGMGEHMLTLAAGLRGHYDIVMAAGQEAGLLDRAAALGLGIKAIDPDDTGGLTDWFSRLDFDIVHVHAGIGWEGQGLAWAARNAGVPTVFRTEHLPYLLTNPAQCQEYADAMRAIDRLICVSDYVAQSHLRSGVEPSLISVVKNGVVAANPVRSRHAVRRCFGLADAPILLMVARFTPQKEHKLLLEALPAILRRHPQTAVLLAGDGPLVAQVAREVASLGLAGTVRLLGERRDCADLMQAADLLVLPSRFEGLPLVLLEAMAAGLPVAATQAPGIAEAIEHGVSGWLCPVGDVGGLADNIIEALADGPRRGQIAKAACDRYRREYQASRMIDETAALYRKASDRSAPAAGGVSPVATKIRTGFIGAGGIAHRHFGVLEQFDDVSIVAVCDIDAGRAIGAASRFGARAFVDFNTMLNDVALDAVFICVPPFAHGAPERAVIARDLPFFVEKPIALDLKTAEAVASSVARKRLITGVGYHWRYLDTVDEVRGLLAANPARLMSGYWLDATPPPAWWWRVEQSGGQMIEQTTHILDLARYLGGDVVRVFGLSGHTARSDFPGLDVPTVSTASLQFASGAIANFASTCLLRWNHRVALHIFGEGLAIELTDHDLMVDVGRGRPVRCAEGDPVFRQDRAFIDAVRGAPNHIRCSYGEALVSHRLALAAVESARTGRAVDLIAAARTLEHV